MFVNIYVWEYIFYNKASKMQKQKSNGQVGRTLVDSLRRATTNIDIDKGTVVSEKPWPQASHWKGFVINCYLLLCNNFNDGLTSWAQCGGRHGGRVSPTFLDGGT